MTSSPHSCVPLAVSLALHSPLSDLLSRDRGGPCPPLAISETVLDFPDLFHFFPGWIPSTGWTLSLLTFLLIPHNSGQFQNRRACVLPCSLNVSPSLISLCLCTGWSVHLNAFSAFVSLTHTSLLIGSHLGCQCLLDSLYGFQAWSGNLSFVLKTS